MFTGTLFESQKPGANFLCQKKTGILAYEQGTGKTIISIAAAEKLRELQRVEKTLVIAPSAIAWQWDDKIQEFTDNETAFVHAKSDFRRDYGAAAKAPYVITSYNLFRRDFQHLSTVDWDLVVCDEAQEFKNNKTKTAKLLKELNYNVRPSYRWALTGTVISTKLEELYSIMYWVDKYFFPDWNTFEKRHIVRNPNTNQIMRYEGLQAISAGLPARLQRKTQKDFGDMPELLESIFYVDKTKELKDAEDRLVDALDDLVERDFSITASGLSSGHSPEVSKAFNEVRELLSGGPKIKAATALAVDALSEDPANRVVIFSDRKQPLYDLDLELGGHAINSWYFTGDQDVPDKRRSVENFRTRGGVLLCSNAGKAGLDLPFANYLYHIDVPFSYEVLDQRNKRITRLTSTSSTAKVKYLIVKKSIEEFYYNVVRGREALSNAVYNGDTDTVIMRTQSLRSFLRSQS